MNSNELRLLLATAADRNGQILVGSTMGGYYVQANENNFVEDTPRSAALWRRVISNLVNLGYLDQTSEGICEITDEGFIRADREIGSAPLELSLSFTGTPDRQVLAVKSNKAITIMQVDFLTSSEAQITDMQVDSGADTMHEIVLDHDKVVSLFNTQRPDMSRSDHSGPATLRLTLWLDGHRKEVLLPVMLQPKFVSNAQWIMLSGSKVITLTNT